MILVYCRDCHAVVSPRDVSCLAEAAWIRQDHEDEHLELAEGAHGEYFPGWPATPAKAPPRPT